MTTIAMLQPGAIATPRGARVAADLFVGLLTWSFSKRTAPQGPLTRAEQAAAVRAMACDAQARDPRFAADLFAAADRHTAQDD